MNGMYFRVVFLGAFSLLTLFSMIPMANANVPSVLQINNISQGSSGKISVQISHSSPTPSHYVDTVEVDVSGQVKQFSLQPQTSDPFTVELDLGQLQGTANVRARAHCTLHGWGSWSNQIAVPEFSELGATILLAFLGYLLFARKAASIPHTNQ
jgi:desulfoferrodoxin (superoxide reductase-like protein)